MQADIDPSASWVRQRLGPAEQAQNDLMAQRYFTVAEVASAIRRSPDFVLLAIKHKRLAARRVGDRKWSIAELDFRQWFNDGGHATPLLDN